MIHDYKDVLLNNKFLRHSMNRIQSKIHRTGTYEIYKISFSCFMIISYLSINQNRIASGCKASLLLNY